jgi:hypothetical protein
MGEESRIAPPESRRKRGTIQVHGSRVQVSFRSEKLVRPWRVKNEKGEIGRQEEF